MILDSPYQGPVPGYWLKPEDQQPKKPKQPPVKPSLPFQLPQPLPFTLPPMLSAGMGTIPAPGGAPSVGGIVDYGNTSLSAAAAASLMSSPWGIIPGGGYRSTAQQADLYARWKAGTYAAPSVAPPGHSLHETGEAFDVDMDWLNANPGFAAWATANGWHNSVPGEPWHWSFGKSG